MTNSSSILAVLSRDHINRLIRDLSPDNHVHVLEINHTLCHLANRLIVTKLPPSPNVFTDDDIKTFILRYKVIQVTPDAKSMVLSTITALEKWNHNHKIIQKKITNIVANIRDDLDILSQLTQPIFTPKLSRFTRRFKIHRQAPNDLRKTDRWATYHDWISTAFSPLLSTQASHPLDKRFQDWLKSQMTRLQKGIDDDIKSYAHSMVQKNIIHHWQEAPIRTSHQTPLPDPLSTDIIEEEVSYILSPFNAPFITAFASDLIKNCTTPKKPPPQDSPSTTISHVTPDLSWSKIREIRTQPLLQMDVVRPHYLGLLDYVLTQPTNIKAYAKKHLAWWHQLTQHPDLTKANKLAIQRLMSQLYVHIRKKESQQQFWHDTIQQIHDFSTHASLTLFGRSLLAGLYRYRPFLELFIHAISPVLSEKAPPADLSSATHPFRHFLDQYPIYLNRLHDINETIPYAEALTQWLHTQPNQPLPDFNDISRWFVATTTPWEPIQWIPIITPLLSSFQQPLPTQPARRTPFKQSINNSPTVSTSLHHDPPPDHPSSSLPRHKSY